VDEEGIRLDILKKKAVEVGRRVDSRDDEPLGGRPKDAGFLSTSMP
jgi:hypothetical protein